MRRAFDSKRVKNLGMLALCVVALSGCSTKLRGPQLQNKIAVMDFRMPPNVTDVKDTEGWWFSSRDKWENPNFGRQLADSASLRVGRAPNVLSLSRVRLKRYFEEKKRRLREATGEDYSAQEALKYLYDAPAQGYARELGVDYLLRGEIEVAYYARNKAVDWPWSVVEVKLELVDGETGQVVWSGSERNWGNFISPLLNGEKTLDQLTLRMDKQFWRLK